MQMRSLRPGFKNRFFVTAAVTALLVSGFEPAFASNRELTSDELNLPAILLPNGTKVPDSLNDPDLWIECIDRMRGSRLPEEFREVARFFKEEGERLGVFWPGVLVQSMHETNYYKYGGDARKESWNVGGVGITKDLATTTHQNFGSLRRGVRAMLEHVAIYADPDRMHTVIIEQNKRDRDIGERFLADRTQQFFGDIRDKNESFRKMAKKMKDPNRPVRFNDLGEFRTEENLNKLRGRGNGKIDPDSFDRYKRTRASIGGATLVYAGDPFYGAKWYLKWKEASSCVQSKYPRKVVLRDFRGEPLKKSKEWLEENRLTVKLNPGVPAPTENKSGTIQEQAPERGTQVKPGDTVTLTVHSKYVSLVSTVVVPDLTGLSYPDAKKKLEAMGLSIVWRDGGRPSLPALANTFQMQDPPAGTQVSKGETVYVWFYGAHTPTREERVAAADCSQYLKSRAYWDNNAGKPLCGCFDGLQWNLNATQCVTADVYAKEFCDREKPGSIAEGTTYDGKPNCVCSQGRVPTADNRSCVEKPIDPPLEKCNDLLAKIRQFMDRYRRDPRNNSVLKGAAQTSANHAQRLGCDQNQINQALSDHQDNIQKPFTINGVIHPSTVEMGGDRQDLFVTWGGKPSFPVKMIYFRKGPCPGPFNCTNMTKQFNTATNPLHFPGALWCSNIQKEGNYYFDYAVVLEDALGNRTQEAPAGFTCKSTRNPLCEQYARRAVSMNQENLNRNCRYTGARWTSDYQGHYNWCIKAPRSTVDSETRAREGELKNCQVKPKDCSHCKVYEDWLIKNAGSCNYQGARLPSICQLDPECIRTNQECNRVKKQLGDCQAKCQGR